MEPYERLILSLDWFARPRDAFLAVKNLGIPGVIVKLGAVLDRYGAESDIVARFADAGFPVFVDFKILDTRDKAAERALVWRAAGAKFLTVHASGTRKMMQQCVQAAGEMKIIAVTVMTSIDHTESMHIYGHAPAVAAMNLAFDAYMAGVHGITASAKDLSEVMKLRAIGNGCLPEMIVTPGIRPVWAPADDQKRIATPAEAIRAGATHLVIGRPIFHPPPEIGSPQKALALILEEIASASAELAITPVDNRP